MSKRPKSRGDCRPAPNDPRYNRAVIPHALLERDDALSRLRRALNSALAGSGRLVLLSGEAGIGKTTLVERFVTQDGAGLPVRWGACEPFLTPRPFGPIHDIATGIEELARALYDSADHDAVVRAWRGVLRTPGIIVIEDLHWADEASLDLLRRMEPEYATQPALVILTTRDDPHASRPGVAAFLEHASGWSIVEPIRLEPLTVAAVRQMAGDDAVDVVALHRETGGNPFFVTEVLATPDRRLPPSVRDAVWARTAALSEASRSVIEAAAILGGRSERWQLEALTDQVETGLAQAVAAGILLTETGSCAFRHDLTREAVLDSIPVTRAIALHRRALQVLETRTGSEQDWTRLAHHAVGAGEPEAIWTYAGAAGRQASWARAHNAAVAWFERALEHAVGRPPAEAAEFFDAYAQELDTIDRRVDCIAARERAAALWESCGNAARAGESLAFLATMLQVVGRMPEALAANARALAALEPLGPSENLLSVYNAQAWLYLGSDRSEAGAELAARAIEMAETIGAHSDIPRLTEIAGLCELYSNHAHGIAQLERSLAASLEQGKMTRAGNTYANLGSIYVDFHQFDRGEAVQSLGLEFARQHELGSIYAFMEGWQAVLEVHRGRWAAADDTIAAALQRTAPSPGRGPALLALGRLRTRRGAGDPIEPLQEALTLLQRQGFRQREGLIRAALAEAAWQAGDRAQVLAQVEAGLPLALRYRQPWYVGELGYWAARAGQPVALPDWTAPAYGLQIAGRWQDAAHQWDILGCPFEKARALAMGDREARLAALAVFEALGARPAADALSADRPTPTAAPQIAGLTPRQSLVLALLAEGLTNAEIASRLRLSVKTVDHHVAAILARLDVHTRDEAVRLTRAAR